MTASAPVAGTGFVGGQTAFAAKHSPSDLASLAHLLAAPETDFLNRKGKIVATLGPASSR